MTRTTAAALVLMLSGTAQAAADACQAAWNRAEKIRVELGLRPGPKVMPEDPLLRPEACEAILRISEERLRESIKETLRICGGDCRDLIERAR